MIYSLNTRVNQQRTRSEIAQEMRLWKGIEDYYIRRVDETAYLTYKKNGKTINLTMANQARFEDNLRVLYLAIRSIRLNEVRGMSEVMESAYLQLAAPIQKKNPYEVLGIYPDSPLEIAEAVFRTMSKKYHPDAKPSGDADKFKELTEAIEELREKDKNK